MKDRAGIDIKVGDRVVYSEAGYGGGSSVSYGEVVDITPHTVLVLKEVPDPPKYKLANDPFYQETHRVRRPDRCILVLWPYKDSL